ncbi:MAG TPA: TonB-dependent receptor [Hanamia sp.]|nr:TonB-dependent receptor [Hanamia sp.]
MLVFSTLQFKKMHSFKLLPLLLVSLFLSSKSIGQATTVTGHVSGTDGQPLAGVSVQEQNTNNGTATDSSGEFSLTVKSPDASLLFSSLGYTSQTVALKGRTNISVMMVGTVTQLEQVVVIGYGTQKKKDLTGASATVKGSEIANVPVLTATQAIQGKVAGVQITSSGAPGSAPNVRIRGVGSILGGASPLYVVDGIITDDIRNINSNDIVSVDILKDASSTAIYGARAANGVVLITTKAGAKGKFQVNYNGYGGVKMLVHTVQMAGPNLFAVYSNDAAGAPNITSADITGSTNWLDEVTRPAIIQNHNISVSGGTNKYKFYFSGGYLNEQGVLKGNDYQRFSLRYNHELDVNSKLKFGNDLSFSHYISQNKPYSVFTQAYLAAPIYNAKNPDGTYGYTDKSDVGNPLATLDYTHDKSYGNRGEGSLWGEYKITKDLSFRSSFGIDLQQDNGQVYVPVYHVNSTQKNETSHLNYNADSIYQWTWDNYFTYTKDFAQKHHLVVTIGHTAERRNGWNENASKDNVTNNPSDWKLNFTDTSGAQQNVRTPIGNYFKRESYFIRANYAFEDKYLVNATFRRDANSNFSPQNRWGNFPALGVGWIITKENFMSKQQFFDNLKLRASYGWVGNDVIGPGAFLLKPTEYLYAYFGTTRVNGAIPTGIIDPNLKWEINKELDLGLEFTLLDRKLSGEIDYYNKRSTNALFTIPLVDLGFGSTFLTNAANILNTGMEFSLSWKGKINQNFNYTVGANATFNKNLVQNVGLGKALYFGSLNNGYQATATVAGQPIGSFWVYKTDGIFQTVADVANYPHLNNTVPGDFKIVDVNGDGVIDSKDRVFVGSYQPKFYGGINGSASWKAFDFSFDIYGNFGNKVYNAKKGVRTGGNYNVEYNVAINRWQPGSNENKYPRAFNGVVPPMDYFVESGSFVRVNNLTLGYTLHPKSLHLASLRVYASAQNPFLFTNYTGFTPELPGNQNEAGIELNAYPVSATYMLGLNLQFE